MRNKSVRAVMRWLVMGLGLFVLLLLSACATRPLKSDLVAAPPEAQPKFWVGCTEILDSRNADPSKQTFQCSDAQGGIWILRCERKK
jgi:hypothetical protein